jgi:hypothetical protein
MPKRKAEEALARLRDLAQQLVGADEELGVDDLTDQLRESGVDMEELKSKFIAAANQVAFRERAAGRPAPLGLQRAIEQLGPDTLVPRSPTAAARKFDRWLATFGSAFTVPDQLEALRAYRKSSEVAADESKELDALEDQLKERIKEHTGGTS